MHPNYEVSQFAVSAGTKFQEEVLTLKDVFPCPMLAWVFVEGEGRQVVPQEGCWGHSETTMYTTFFS